MYLIRTVDQVELARACRGVLQKEWPRADVAERLRDPGARDQLWALMADMGWLEVLRSETDGGLGLGIVEGGAVAEEAGRALVPGPVIEAIAAARWPGVDPAAASVADPAHCRLETDGRRVSGVARFLPEPGPAGVLVLVDGVRVVAADLGSSGVSVSPAGGLDDVAPLCTVSLREVPVAVLDDDPASVTRLQITMQTLTAAYLLGMADAALDLAVAYVLQREQFGQVVGSFQAVQQSLADARKRTLAARSACYASQAALAEERPDAAHRAAAAKVYAATTARAVVEAAIQAHGGIGFTAEVPLHLYLKRALTLQGRWGTSDDLRLQLSRSLLERTRR
jgi:alkylation response protein AidB-like acyl-CoA dehydrogenase